MMPQYSGDSGRLPLAAAMLVALLPVAPIVARAADGKLISTFAGADGAGPQGPLVQDTQGRLYGAALVGGQYNVGTVFRLTPPSNGSNVWTKEVVHSFSGADGADPWGGLLLDSAGNIYGTTFAGGSAGGGGAGVVFRPGNAPGWPVTVLHSFTGKETDANEPNGGLVFGPGGLIYGTTFSAVLDGGSEVGAAFSISPLGDATEYAIIHKFSSSYGYKEGVSPTIGLVPGGPNKFYGATLAGGRYNLGVIFALTLQSDGTWRESVLHSFNSSGDISDLAYQGSLVRGAGSTLYACGGMGGAHGVGGVISLTLNGVNQSTETVLDNFGSSPGDPANLCALTVQPTGSLIGTSLIGGRFGYGTVFDLTPPAMQGGPWAQTVLQSFGLAGPAGGYTGGALLRQGSLYYGANETGPGTGPQAGTGTVFSFRP